MEKQYSPLENMVNIIKNAYQGQTVLVTGHTGFKGSWLCETLLILGARVIGYSVDIPTNPALFELLKLDHRMTSVIGDIRDYNCLKEVIAKYKPTIVFHLAAQSLVIDSYKNPKYTYETNIMGTVNLFEAIRNTDFVKSIINVTTDKVYENNDKVGYSFREDDKLCGHDPYSNSKSCSELVTHSYKKAFFEARSLPISTVRAGNVIGGGDFSANRIIPDCVRAVINGEPIGVRNKNSTRPYQFVMEPLLIYLYLAIKQIDDISFSGSYNIGPEIYDVKTTGEIVNLFCNKWGNDARWIDKTAIDAPHEASYLSLDISLIKNKLKWRPIYTLDETMSAIVEFSKAFSRGDSVNNIVKKQINIFLEKGSR
ncbi:MAG: CDP-glucose 4,6-dehydratase [Bacilli bacterium]|jgi:CDP-glucose 4,6-dehydratase|nr:CDP-glucose 4,6-dehydratase [Bacilli bacterium]